MKIWKFRVPSETWVPDPEIPGRAYRGIVAATVAETEEKARERLKEYANDMGFDSGWLRVAKVVELTISENAVIVWAEV